MSKRKPARTIKARSASKIRSKAAGSGQPKGRVNSKQARVLALLCGPSGATIATVTRSTGWQPHTVRAFLAAGSAWCRRRRTAMQDIQPLVGSVETFSAQGDERFARGGAMFTDAVAKWTALLLLRLRYRLIEATEEFAEEIVLAAFERGGRGPHWLEPCPTAGRELAE